MRPDGRAFLRDAGAGTPLRVKLCGLSRPQDVAAANAALPDLCGFIVGFPKSHRNVDPAALPALSAQVSERIVRCGVFVDAPVGTVAALAGKGAIDAVQLHGSEDEAYIAELRHLLPARTGIIQAFRVRTAADVQRACESSADMLLLDSGQGSGETFDWSLVAHVPRPFILAGGLTPENVARAIDQVHPFGVDVSSGTETAKRKDPAKMTAFVRNARGASGAPRGQTP